MLFFIVFLISPTLAERFWLLLVLYCELCIFVVYFWQFPPVQDVSQSRDTRTRATPVWNADLCGRALQPHRSG